VGGENELTTALQEAPNVETLLPLTAKESKRLKECEKVIEQGLHTFYDVGNALTEIRESRLYRMEYATFDDYCRERWRMSKTHANRLIESSAVVANLTPIGVIPGSESQARELAPLAPEVQRAVWQIAIKTAPTNKQGEPTVTAAHIKAVADVLTDVVKTGGMDDGSGVIKPLGQLIDAAVTEETYERMMRQKEHIKEKLEASADKERNARFKSDRSEVEVVYEPRVQEQLARYIEMITEFENFEWPGELDYFARMFQVHKAHAHFQKTRNLADDSDEILSVIKKLCPDIEDGYEIAAQELYDWLFDLGYCMSKREYMNRLRHMSRDDVRMLLLTDAGDGKQENRRGALPGIICLPWKKVRKLERICEDCGKPNDRKNPTEYPNLCRECVKEC
jgi:hypothetical protein